MGAFASTSNVSDITNNTSVNDSEACNTSQLVYANNGPVTIINTGLGSNLTINSTKSTTTANCKFNTAISATAKATADQTANSTADTGLPVAADFAVSTSSNVVNLQNNIEMALNAACGTTQAVTINNTSVVLNGDVIKGAADINTTDSTVNATCVMDIQQQAAESGATTQTATASATNLDPMVLFLILGAILLVIVLFMGGGKALFGIVKAPAKAAGAIGSAGDSAATRLAASRASLAKAQAARAGAAAGAGFGAGPMPPWGMPGTMGPWGGPMPGMMPGMAPGMMPGMAPGMMPGMMPGMPWGGPPVAAAVPTPVPTAVSAPVAPVAPVVPVASAALA